MTANAYVWEEHAAFSHLPHINPGYTFHDLYPDLFFSRPPLLRGQRRVQLGRGHARERDRSHHYDDEPGRQQQPSDHRGANEH